VDFQRNLLKFVAVANTEVVCPRLWALPRADSTLMLDTRVTSFPVHNIRNSRLEFPWTLRSYGGLETGHAKSLLSIDLESDAIDSGRTATFKPEQRRETDSGRSSRSIHMFLAVGRGASPAQPRRRLRHLRPSGWSPLGPSRDSAQFAAQTRAQSARAVLTSSTLANLLEFWASGTAARFRALGGLARGVPSWNFGAREASEAVTAERNLPVSAPSGDAGPARLDSDSVPIRRHH
jgi:hypothetical protein